MSDTLKTPRNAPFKLTRFAGPDETRVYVSVGYDFPKSGEYGIIEKPITLTRKDAKALAKVLNDFANNNETVIY